MFVVSRLTARSAISLARSIGFGALCGATGRSRTARGPDCGALVRLMSPAPRIRCIPSLRIRPSGGIPQIQ